jgi:hypothetical protein
MDLLQSLEVIKTMMPGRYQRHLIASDAPTVPLRIQRSPETG